MNLRTDYSEKRRFERIEDDLGIAMRVKPNGTSSDARFASFCLTRDISLGGLRFQDEQELPKDAVLDICFAIKSPPQAIRMTGRVCRTDPLPDSTGFDVGVELVDAAPADYAKWKGYVEARISGDTGGVMLQ